MRFRTKQRPRGLLKPADQRRIIFTVASLGMVLFCVTIVRRPQFWDGMFPNQPAATTSPVADSASNSIQHDEFFVGSSAGETVSVTAKKIPLSDVETSGSGGTEVLRVPEDVLKHVKDDVIGVHSTESEAYYASLKMASRLTEQQGDERPRGAYALFIDSPETVRGSAFRIEGKLRQLSARNGTANIYGGGSVLYDAWLTTSDSGDQLVHVVCANADAPLSALITNRKKTRTVKFLDKNAPNVRFSGYFFKREGYASHHEDGISIAPLFVSGRLQDNRQPVVLSTRADEITPYLGGLATVIACAIALIVLGFAKSDHTHANTRAHQLTKLPAHVTFEGVTAVTVAESLGKLEVPGDAKS